MALIKLKKHLVNTSSIKYIYVKYDDVTMTTDVSNMKPLYDPIEEKFFFYAEDDTFYKVSFN